MNLPRVAIGAVVAWIVSLVVGFVVNALLLVDIYQQHASVMRPAADLDALLPAGFAASLLGFFAFSYTYAVGYEGGRGVQEGLRFGVLLGLMLVGFSLVWQYVVFPLSAGLLMAWIVDTIVEFAIYGMIVGALYKPARSADRQLAA